MNTTTPTKLTTRKRTRPKPRSLNKDPQPVILRKGDQLSAQATHLSQTQVSGTDNDAENVGYGRPPKHSQFKPGRSGNPKGRPRKTEAKSKSLKSIVVEELLSPMTINENGRQVTLPAVRVGLRRLSVEAAKGNISAIRLHAKLAKEFMVNDYDEIALTPQQEVLLKELLDDE